MFSPTHNQSKGKDTVFSGTKGTLKGKVSDGWKYISQAFSGMSSSVPVSVAPVLVSQRTQFEPLVAASSSPQTVNFPLVAGISGEGYGTTMGKSAMSPPLLGVPGTGQFLEGGFLQPHPVENPAETHTPGRDSIPVFLSENPADYLSLVPVKTSLEFEEREPLEIQNHPPIFAMTLEEPVFEKDHTENTATNTIPNKNNPMGHLVAHPL